MFRPSKSSPLRIVWAALLLAVFASPLLAAAELDGEERGQATLGKHSYRSFCSSCHGPEGKGDGSLAPVLVLPPADLTVLAKENGGEFPMERTIAIIDGREKVRGHGGGDMPAWGDAFQQIAGSEEEVQKKIRQLAIFVKSIQEE